jgi:hypothetical protein
MKAASGPQGMSCGPCLAQPAPGARLASSSSRTRPCASASSSRSAAISSRRRLLSSSAVRSLTRIDSSPARLPTGSRAGARWWPRCRSMSARRPGSAVEELAAHACPRGNDRERDRVACPLELDQRAAGAPSWTCLDARRTAPHSPPSPGYDHQRRGSAPHPRPRNSRRKPGYGSAESGISTATITLVIRTSVPPLVGRPYRRMPVWPIE